MAALSKVFSAELDGIEARLIEVETDIHVGLHSFTIVGLADKALSEAKERVNAALKNSQIRPPTKENRRIVVNLAPADVKKNGSQYDLAIALGYLLASSQIRPFDAEGKLFAGELALDGTLRPIRGALAIATLAASLGYPEVFLPALNAHEASFVAAVSVHPVSSLTQLISHLEERERIHCRPSAALIPAAQPSSVDVSEIKGQHRAKRALTIAAAGGHNLLFVGPPGTGKTMLASSLCSLMPPLTLPECIEATKIYSAAGLLGDLPLIAHRPFRSPHHTASTAAIVGGGQTPRPGEISLAHRGVLFLDELPEFRRDVLEALRQPLESGSLTISRAQGTLTLPARFTLVAAMNPCPCGYFGDGSRECTCSPSQVLRYQKRLSGPLLDRIDLQVEVPRVDANELRVTRSDAGEAGRLRSLVLAARLVQRERLTQGTQGNGKQTNAELSSKECDDLIELTAGADTLLCTLSDRSLVSPRSYYRTLKLARTIADLADSETVTEGHVSEAFSYRVKATSQ